MASSKNIPHNGFDVLNDDELRLLCFLAYHGEDMKIASGAEYRKHIKLGKKDYDDAINRLNELGYLQGQTYVKPEWHIRILKELWCNHAEWTETFKEICSFTRSTTAEYLCNVVKYIIAGDYAGAAKMRRPYEGIGYKQFNLLKYLQAVTEEDLRFIKMMNEYEVREMTHDILATQFAKDELSIDTLNMLRNLITENNKFGDELLSEISAYEYFQFGNTPPAIYKENTWSAGVKAMTLLYQDKLDESIEQFWIALHHQARNSKAFDNAIFNYAYGIALHKKAKRNSNMYAGKLSEFLGDKRVRFQEENAYIRQLLEAVDGKNDSNGSLLIRNKRNEKTDSTFAYILANFAEQPAEHIHPSILHSAAFFQHEMSEYLKIGPDSRQKLSSLFCGTPLISKLRKRPSWEIAFQEIEDSISRIQNKEKRIAYYLNGYDLEAIVEQTKEEEGWKDGQVLSLSQIAKNGSDTMDSNDTIIANTLSETGKYEGAAKVIIPILFDSGRLFYGSYYDSQKESITIEKETPYLTFEGKGDIVEIDSNLELTEDGSVQKSKILYTSPGNYVLTTANPFQRDVIKKFLTLKKVPATAAVSLKKAAESLKGIIDVRGGNLDALIKPTALSKGILAVRIIPQKNEYATTIMATAMENGNGRFAPAEGSQLVYDEVENVTHCINRDLDKEHSNYVTIRDYMEEELMCEFDSYTETTIYSDESLLKFIAFIYDHQENYFIEWPEGKPLRFRGDVTSGDIVVNVKSEIEWFSMNGLVKTKTINISLEDLIRSCCNSQVAGFVKINDSEYVRMSEELKRHIAALEGLASKKEKTRKIPKYQVGALASMIRNLNVIEDGGYSKFMQQTREAYQITPEIPEELNAKLRDYQIEGYRWMCRLSAWGAGACLADDMGLGKTIQAIAFLLHKCGEGPSLVIAPKSVIPNWENEIARFAPSLHCINLNAEKKRNIIIKNVAEREIVLCTYGVLATESSNITSKKWNVVCLDEAHTIKNRNTQASQVSMELNAKSRIILTGTPLQNNLGELWNLFQFINPGLLGTWSVFRDSFMIPALDSEHKALLKEMTMPFILRRTKQDVLKDLPEKLISEKLVDLTENEQKVYEEMRRRAEVKFKERKSRVERAEAKTLDIDFFTELTHLREAACSMRLVYEEWTDKSSKIEALMDILDTIMDYPENNVIVFSQFTSFLELIKPELEHRKMPYLYLDGQTSMENRKKYVEEFQEGRCRLFLSSLKAGGFGLNLTKANYIIILDPWWNPSVENQAMDRAHRIGQKRVVSVIRLISAQTIEEKILRLHEEKQRLTDDILEGTAESSKLTYEDVMDMVSPF